VWGCGGEFIRLWRPRRINVERLEANKMAAPSAGVLTNCIELEGYL